MRATCSCKKNQWPAAIGRPDIAGAAMELGSPMTPSAARTPLLAQVERARDVRKHMYGKLCRLGVIIRLLTFLNGLALLGATGYSLYFYGQADIINSSLTYEWRVRTGVEYALMGFSGLFLLSIERAATTDEAAMRSSLGLAFSAGGRFWLLLFLAVISLPNVHTLRDDLEMYLTGGAVAALVVSALLQAWMLSCVPEYRSHVVADCARPASNPQDGLRRFLPHVPVHGAR